MLTAMGRLFAEEIARVTKGAASVAQGETGAVSFVQRFGGSLNLHVHFHTLAVDPSSRRTAIEELAQRVRDRALRFLRRRGYLEERPAQERGNDTPALSAIDASTEIALAGGALLARPAPPPEGPEDDFERKDKRFAASCDGFDVHCAVGIAANDDEGRERLARYCAQRPFALDRIERLHDGRVAYRVLSVSPRIAWAVLIKRTFGFDVLRCPKCSRR